MAISFKVPKARKKENLKNNHRKKDIINRKDEKYTSPENERTSLKC